MISLLMKALTRAGSPYYNLPSQVVIVTNIYGY